MKLSIVLTMHNRSKLLEQSLFALTRWYDYFSEDVELVVVEDISEDKSVPKLLKEYKPYFERVVYILMDKKRSAIPVFWNSPALGINLAVKHASNDCIVKTDPECLPICDVVSLAQELYTPHKLYFFSVRMLTERENPEFDIERLKEKHPEDIYLEKLFQGADLWYIEPPDRKLPYWFGALFSRDKFIEIGGVEEEFLKGFAGEDDEFAERLRRNGVNWAWDNRLKILHQFHGTANKQHHLSDEHYHNINLLHKSRDLNIMKGNEGRDWGSDQVIVEKVVL